MTDTVHEFDAPRGWQVTITLRDIRPPVWRRLVLPDHLNFAELHEIIQAAFGWTDSHLHQFSAGGLVIGAPEFDEDTFSRHRTFEATEIFLHDLIFLGQEPGLVLYEYDFGDSWIHAIEFDTPVILERGGIYPLLLGGERAAPPEDVGGPGGYERFLEAWRNPLHEEYAETRRWAGRRFDPETFDAVKTQKAILTSLRRARKDYRFRQER